MIQIKHDAIMEISGTIYRATKLIDDGDTEEICKNNPTRCKIALSGHKLCMLHIGLTNFDQIDCLYFFAEFDEIPYCRV